MMRIGEFALASGLTVKALHHYDAIDLLKPARVTANGYRTYSPRQLREAATIRALRNIGLALDTVAEALSNPHYIIPSSNDTEHMSLTNAHDKMLTRRKGPR